MADTVVIGVGNRMMGDDAVGPVVIDRLVGRLPETVALIESVGDATHLLDTWRDARLAVVVDAAVSGDVPGSVHRIDGKAGFPASWRSASTHLIGLVEAVDLGGAVDMLPNQLVVYGIEIGRVGPGMTLSPEIDTAADEVVDMITAELAETGSQ
ncbi:MAG: hydrogenase maturation protease [Actinomycetota bacterium]|nr:hydrogenase maturation protease [Actinomycetota bacterium]